MERFEYVRDLTLDSIFILCIKSPRKMTTYMLVRLYEIQSIGYNTYIKANETILLSP